MKYVKEIVIIFGITMVGELLNMFIPLPVPAGVYGLFILLGGLCTKVISLSDVEVTGNLLLDLMPEAADFLDRLARQVARKQEGAAARDQKLALPHDGRCFVRDGQPVDLPLLGHAGGL